MFTCYDCGKRININTAVAIEINKKTAYLCRRCAYGEVKVPKEALMSYEEAMMLGINPKKEVEWLKANCPICGKEFEYTSIYKPTTCGKFSCVQAAVKQGLIPRSEPYTGVSYRNPKGKVSRYKPIHCGTCGGLIANFDRQKYPGYHVPMQDIMKAIRHHYMSKHPGEFAIRWGKSPRVARWYRNPTSEFYVKVGDKGVLRISKEESRGWDETLVSGDVYGVGKRYMGYLTKQDILNWIQGDFPRDEVRFTKKPASRYHRNPKIHPEAIESLKRYKDDLKAGHKNAAEYWRGQAGAYFTANPICPHCHQSYDKLKPDPHGRLRCPKCGWFDMKNPFLTSIATGAGLGIGVVAAKKVMDKVWKNPKRSRK